MLYKLLWRKQPLWQLIGAGLGVLVGTTLLMLSLQIHHSIKLMLGNEDKVFPSRYLTLSKKVSILSNLPGMRSSFSQNEIEQIKKINQKRMPFVLRELSLGLANSFKNTTTGSAEIFHTIFLAITVSPIWSGKSFESDEKVVKNH